MNDDTQPGKLVDEMNRYYDARASWHDYYMEYESNERMEALLRPIVDDVAKTVTGKRILEIACGTGIWTEALAKRAAHVVAVDSSSQAIELARSKLSARTNVILKVADAYDLDDVQGEYDVIFASDWWSHIPKGMIMSFIDGLRPKLLPSGRAIFLDMSMREYFAHEPCYYDDDGNRISLRRLPDGSEFRVVKNFPTEPELRELLKSHAREVTYKQYDTLRRWMMSFSLS